MLDTPSGDRILPAQPSATHAPVDTVIDTNFPLGNDVFARIRRHRGALRLIVRMRIDESGHMYTIAFIRCQAPAAASRQKNGCLTIPFVSCCLSFRRRFISPRIEFSGVTTFA